MIYYSKNLPNCLLDPTGFTLCRLWFMTKKGFNVLDFKSFDTTFFQRESDKVKFVKVSPFKVSLNGDEIIRLKDKYFVGDGKGSIIYDPFINSEEVKLYKKGELPIVEKYFEE